MRLSHTLLAAAGALLIAGTAHAQTTTTPRPDRTEQRAKRREMAKNATPEQLAERVPVATVIHRGLGGRPRVDGQIEE